MAATGIRRVPVAGGTLFHHAALYLSRAEQWTRIAASNGSEDPWSTDVSVLTIPKRDPRADNTGILWPTYRLAPKPQVVAEAPVVVPATRDFRFDQVNTGFTFDATGLDAPTFDQAAPVVVVPPTTGGGGTPGGPTTPPAAKPDFSMQTIGPTFDDTTGETFDNS